MAEDESRYLLDYASSVPKVLMELEKDANGDWQIVRKNYYYGDMLVMSTDGSDGDRWYYFHDKLGSVRAVVDGSGAVLNNYSYTPWGAEIESQTTETVRNNVRYAGYQYDNDLKQYYLWARMYSPYLARFNGYDPVRGDYKSPLTLNPYLYCLNDPVNRWDPSGRLFLDISSAMVTRAKLTMDSYNVASGAMDIARQLNAGMEARAVVTDIAISKATDYAMTAVFGLAAKGASKVVKNYLGWCKRIEKHHVIPKFLGGADDGMMVGLSRKLHRGKGNSYHNILRKKLYEELGEDCPKNLSAKGFDKLFETQPHLRAKAHKALIEAAGEFDSIHGGDIMTTATLTELVNQFGN